MSFSSPTTWKATTKEEKASTVVVVEEPLDLDDVSGTESEQRHLQTGNGDMPVARVALTLG